MKSVTTTAQDRLTVVGLAAAKDLGMKEKGGVQSGGRFFTGWKQHPNGGFVGQVVEWCAVEGEKGPCAAYVNLPGLECGVVNPGQSFEFGNLRLDLNITVEEMKEMLRSASKKMDELISERGLKLWTE